jgi:hypothetical protein
MNLRPDMSFGFSNVVIFTSLVYPHETTTGIVFSGEMVMASTGQYMRHK